MRCKVLMESRYRGKKIIDGKWVYGTYIKQGNNHFIIPKINKNGYAKCIAVSKDTVSKFVIGMNNEAWFDGDILEQKYEKWLGIIRCFVDEYVITRIEKGNLINFDIDSASAFRRIGNRWDNPELVKEIESEWNRK